MISKQMMVIVSASVIALGMAVTSTAFMTDASGQDSSEISQKSSAPRYSETCAHGHNGFNCKPVSYRVDLNDLEQRVAELERRP